MVEWPLVFMGGLLGSSHCVGMCGAFALSIGMGSTSLAQNVRRQLVYSLGRIFTYSFLGSSAGFASFWLVRRVGPLVDLQGGFSVLAGLVLVAQGLLALGILPRVPRLLAARTGSGCLVGSFVRPFFLSGRWHHVLVAGVLTGFLPCGLVYGFLALATSSSTMLGGLATMAVFGLGTVPLMVLTGAGASLLSHAARRHLLRVAAVCVLLTGLICLARGIHALHRPESPCPGCSRCAADS